MNLLAITDVVAGLPIYSWIIIGVAVLVIIIAVAVLAAKRVREKKGGSAPAAKTKKVKEEKEEAPADWADEAEPEVQPEPVKSAPAAPAQEKSEAPAAKTVKEAPVQKSEPVKTEPVKTEPVKAEKPAPAAAKIAPAEEVDDEAEAAAEISAAAKYNGPKVYHITKRMSDGKWQIKFNKGKKAIKLFDTQAQAIDYAKALAQNQEASIMIHKEDGTFRKLRYDKPNK